MGRQRVSDLDTVKSCNKELDDLDKRRQEILKRKKKLEEDDNKKIGAMIRRIFRNEVTSTSKAEQKAFFENLNQLRKKYAAEFDVMMIASGFEKKEQIENLVSGTNDKTDEKADNKTDKKSDEQPKESDDDGSEEELSGEQTEESDDEAGSDKESSGEESVLEDESESGEQDA